MEPLPTGEVTLVFTDIEGSTRLLRKLGARYGGLLELHNAVLRDVWSRHGGVEIRTEGDAFFVAFQRARDALDAAAAAQHALAETEWPGGVVVRVRTGVHTGRPELHDDNYWGEDVHYAARVCSAAHGGQVLVSAATAAAVPEADLRRLGEHRLKDFPEPRLLFQQPPVDGVSFPPPRTLDAVPTNLPAPAGGLLGRERELAEVARRLAGDKRLVTITGAGGIGKTHLALVAAREVLGRFPDGVFLVRLDEVSDPGAVVGAVAATLGLPEVAGVATEQRLSDHLADRRVLLVLDNLEHLLAAAPDVRRIVEAGPGVRVLATSQAPLRIPGEEVVPLPPLEVPSHGASSLAELEAIPSVALLLRRARAATGSFELTAGNAAALTAITRRLDGVPLALELAAVRLSVLEPADLLARLERSPDVLGDALRDLPPRQRGLRAVLDWTVHVLDRDAREAFARLSVLPGGFRIELAEAAWPDVLPHIGALLDVSLLRRDAQGRLRMAPPVRRHAAELLEHSGASHAAHRAAAEALLAIAGGWDVHWATDFGARAQTLREEAANIREMIAWARRADPALHARLVAASAWYVWFSGRHSEALDAARAALTATPEPRVRARLLDGLSLADLVTEDVATSREAVDAWRALGDPLGLAMALAQVSEVHAIARAGDDALRMAREAMAAVPAGATAEELSFVTIVYGQALGIVGRHREAIEVLEEVARTSSGGFPEFAAHTCLADALLAEGNPAEALLHYAESLRLIRGLQTLVLEVLQVDAIGMALDRLGRSREAAIALAVARIARASVSLPDLPAWPERRDAIERKLDPEVLAAGAVTAAEMGARGGIAWAGEAARRAALQEARP